jgi:hypothetical protein
VIIADIVLAVSVKYVVVGINEGEIELKNRG